MRVLHLITGLETGGAETALMRLLLGLRELDGVSECRVVSLIRPGHVGREMARQGIDVAHLGMRRGAPSPASLWRLAGMIRSFRPGLLCTWLYHADLVGLAGAWLATAGRLPVLWNLRCSYMDFSRYPRTTAWTVGTLARLSRFPACMAANSAAALAHHASLGYRPRRAEVIENGVDCGRFRPDPAARERVGALFRVPARAVLAGMAGRFDPMKDVPTLLAGLARAPGVHLLLCGQGMDAENRELAALLAREGVAGRVHLAGHRADLPELLPGLDVAVSPSLGESFPNVLAEAMACGVPPVATDAGLSRTLVGEAGLVVPTGDPEALGAALAEMAALPKEERLALGLAARERIAAGWSLGASVRAHAALWADLARPS
jgi:glycosyltransferase involved in cell wall biosynthesis